MSVDINSAKIHNKCISCHFSKAFKNDVYGEYCPMWTVCFEKYQEKCNFPTRHEVKE